MKRLLFIIVWTVGSFFGWMKWMSLLTGVVYRMVAERQVFPTWTLQACFIGLWFGGTLLIPAIVAVLGMRGKLPGTARARGLMPRGFEIGSADRATRTL